MNHGHGGHQMGPKCSMNMLWNTQIVDTCVVFRQWHISSNFSFFVSCCAIVVLGIFYEYLREIQKTLDRRIALSLAKGKAQLRSSGSSGRTSPEAEALEQAGLLNGRKVSKPPFSGTPIPPFARVLRAFLYGATIFLSFFLMLIFMTYNAYLILAVVAGAAIGHYIFGANMDVDAVLSGGGAAGGKSMACH